MGIRESTTNRTSGTSSDDGKLHKLYKELRCTASDSVSDEEFKGRFVHYFGGPCPHLGELLYRRLFGAVGTLNEDTFVSAMNDFKRLSDSSSTNSDSFHEAEKFYFYVFSQGNETLNKDGLKEVIRIACLMALVVGSELHEKAVVPRDSPIIESLATSAMILAEEGSQELSVVQFTVWVKEHCPKLLEGITHWTETLLSHCDTTEPQSDAAAAFHTSYHLPTPKVEADMSEDQVTYMYLLIWSLSTIVPLIYMGHKRDESAAAAATNKHPIGGTWTRLYSSSTNGLSMNGFKSHCFDYREPSLMILTTKSIAIEDRECQFIIGVDKEWKDGAFFWGEKDCFLLELKPSFSVLKTGGNKLVSLNEKQRGFPTGLRFMADDSHKRVLLEIDSSLEKGERNGLQMNVIKIEVWGCGGMEAIDSQKKAKEWERKEISRRQLINKDKLKEDWANSPDRYILELGGVTVNNPKEQQQQ